MEKLLAAAFLVWVGYKLKEILSSPHESPLTTRQYFDTVKPAPKHPICIYCDDPPLPGRYFCSEHIYHDKEIA